MKLISILLIIALVAFVRADIYELEEDGAFILGGTKPTQTPKPSIVIKLAKLISPTEGDLLQMVLDTRKVYKGIKEPAESKSLSLGELESIKNILKSEEYTKLQQVSQFVPDQTLTNDIKWVMAVMTPSPADAKIIGWTASTPTISRPSFTTKMEDLYNSRDK